MATRQVIKEAVAQGSSWEGDEQTKSTESPSGAERSPCTGSRAWWERSEVPACTLAGTPQAPRALGRAPWASLTVDMGPA